jgi:hypothetical protein
VRHAGTGQQNSALAAGKWRDEKPRIGRAAPETPQAALEILSKSLAFRQNAKTVPPPATSRKQQKALPRLAHSAQRT